MKNLLLVAVAGFLLTSCSNSSSKQDSGHADSIKNDGTYTVSAGETSLKWAGKAATHGHNGTVKVSSGSFMVENGMIKSGTFEVDMTSIVCDDEKDSTKNANLVGHLKGPDFFNVDTFKTATFAITSVAPAKNGGIDVTGDLTLRGVKQQMVIPASVAYDTTGGVKVTSSFKVDRAKHNIKYNSKSFFDVKALADKTIDDEIELTLELVAKK